MAGAAAWLVAGAKHHVSVYLDHARAAAAAVEHHGVLLPLVLADEVSEMLKAAYVQGQAAASAAHAAHASHGGSPVPASATQPTQANGEARP